MCDATSSSSGQSSGDVLLPSVGCYVAISIDPVGTLESLEDADVNSATAKMKTQTYVGFVEEALNAGDFDHPFRAIKVQLLHSKLPTASISDGVDPAMCCPVLPTSHHPGNREALKPNKPLPWTSCYHHTTFPSAVIRVQTDYGSDRDFTIIDGAEESDFNRYRSEDMSRQEKLQEVYKKIRHGDHQGSSDDHPDGRASNAVLDQTKAVQEEPASGQPGSLLNGPAAATAEASNPPRATAREPEAFTLDDLADLMAMMEEAAKEARPHDTMTLAVVSYDLPSVQTFGEPEDFFKEQKYLLQLEKQAKTRAIERARLVDEKTYGEPSRTSWSKLRRRLMKRRSRLSRAISRRAKNVLLVLRAFTQSHFRERTSS